MKISDFSGCLGKASLTLPNGRTVEARELSAGDDRALKAAMPPPIAPLVKDPTKGSAAPRIQNPEDPAFVAEFNAWFSRRAVVRLACAIGWQDSEGRAWDRHAPVEQAAAWCDAAFEAMTDAMSVAQLDRLNNEYREQTEAGAEGVGLGNSGPGSNPEPG